MVNDDTVPALTPLRVLCWALNAALEGRLRLPLFRDVYVHHTPTNNRARLMIDQRNFHDFTTAACQDQRAAYRRREG